MTDLQEKINKLRQKYTDPDSIAFIDDQEKALRELIVRESLSKNPAVKAVVKDALDRIADINQLLSYDEQLNDIKRQSLFRQREVWEFIVARFGFQPNTFESLNEMMDEELAR